MDADRETWEAAKLKTETGTAYAPQPVLMAMMSLMSPHDVADWVAQTHEVGGATRWHVMWISTEALLTCSAHKDYGGWDFSTHETRQSADTLEVSLSPLRQISSVELADFRSHGVGLGAEWNVTATVHLATGAAFTVPALPDVRHDRERTEAVLKRLCAAVR